MPIDELITQLRPPNATGNISATGAGKLGAGKLGGGKPNVEEKLRNVAKLLSGDVRVGFILIYKITKSPIEYNLSVLNQPLDTKAGITKGALDGTETMRVLASGKSGKSDAPDASDKITIINDEFRERNVYYVLETLDGVSFRQLVTTRDTIPDYWFTTDPARMPSRRLGGYNCILNDAIKPHLHEPLISDNLFERTEIVRDAEYWRGIRVEILRILDDVPKTAYRNLRDLKAALAGFAVRAGDLIHFDLFKSNISESRADVRDIINREIYVSYLHEINALNRSFFRDLEINYNRESERLQRLDDSTLRDEVYKILMSILERLINGRSNIYISIDNKFSVLMKAL